MVRIAPVRLQYNPRTLWFDPNGLEVRDGDAVVVSTERGMEYGHALDIIEVEQAQVDALKSPLKPIVRLATDEDAEHVEELARKGKEALPVFKRLAEELNLDMRPILVEYLFGEEKAVFFFEAEERVDFRELVKRLSSELSVRVDMRQIGVRDEARMIGGLGHCGQELCCKRLGGEFCPVSIRMAKEQDLSLNPTKISGVCGRLMCCLRYEYDAYKDFKSRAPKMNAKITTPCGMAKVCDLDVPREMITVKLEEDDKRVKFPLSAMDPAEEGARPNSIGEVFDEYANPDPFADGVGLGLFDTASFTREDKLADGKAHHNPSRSAQSDEDGEKPARKPRRRRRKQGSGQAGSSDAAAKSGGSKDKSGSAAKDKAGKGGSKGSEGSGSQRRRRRNRSGGAKGAQGGSGSAGAQAQSGARPGQKSSGLAQSGGGKAAKDKAPAPDTHRKSRRRSHRSGGQGGSEAKNES